MKRLHITKIVNASILQKLPDSMYNATGFATGIHDENGNLITTIGPKCYCDFCRGMFYNKEGHVRCVASNRMGAQIALNKGGVYVYDCHAGLTDVSAPVIISGCHIASVSTGQVLLEKLTDQKREDVRKKLQGLPPDMIERQMIALEQVRVVSHQQIKGVAELLSSIANTIVDLIVYNAKEKEINTSNSRLIDSIRFTAMLEAEQHNAQIRLRESELKFLQLQINPHFLYNTLDSIYWLAVLQRPHDIQQMVVSLSALLRQSLDTSVPVLTLSQELENVKHYLYIQKVRLGLDLNYVIDVEPEIVTYQLPKLILQTLVENSLKHGIEPRGTAGFVSIHGWKTSQDDAVLEISDNGLGIGKDRLDMLRRCLEDQSMSIPDTEKLNGTGIGLINVQKRLLYYYNNYGGLTIESFKNKGTTISFRISPNIDGSKLGSTS